MDKSALLGLQASLGGLPLTMIIEEDLFLNERAICLDPTPYVMTPMEARPCYFEEAPKGFKRRDNAYYDNKTIKRRKKNKNKKTHRK